MLDLNATQSQPPDELEMQVAKLRRQWRQKKYGM
jgi:hypothetical protein